MSSVTMHMEGASTTAPKKSTMFGCRKSRINRISAANSFTVACVETPSVFFTATFVPCHLALYTFPNEPVPIFLPKIKSLMDIDHEPAALINAREERRSSCSAQADADMLF